MNRSYSLQLPDLSESQLKHWQWFVASVEICQTLNDLISIFESVHSGEFDWAQMCQENMLKLHSCKNNGSIIAFMNDMHTWFGPVHLRRIIEEDK